MKPFHTNFVILAAAAALTLVLLSGGVIAVPMAVIENVTPSTAEPGYEDTITITANLVLVDSEVTDGDVVLGWFPCTDLTCDQVEYLDMTMVENGTWTAGLGPFDETSQTGDPYVKITFFVEVRAHATDGSDDPEMLRSDPRNIYFSTSPQDGENNTEDDPQDDGESDMGTGVAIGGVLLAAFIMRRSRA